MSTIIVEMPWHCGEQDCPVGWHKANYWFNEDGGGGYTVDSYADGDHEEVDDVPLPEEVEKAWKSYARYVAETGEDPLGAYYVKRTMKEEREYKAVVSPKENGLTAVFEGRKSGAAEEYLSVDCFDTLAAFTKAAKESEEVSNVEERGAEVLISFILTEEIARPEEAVKRELIARARGE